MACEQRSRTSNETQLLPSVVVTEQQSLVVVKKMLAIAVSTITYLRGLFPEKAYGSKYVEEQKVMILRDERSCPGAKQIVQWMHGCFDALQKKYLRSVRLSIYTDPENPQKVTECYQFKIQYTERGPQMDFESHSNKSVSRMSCDSTKKSSILLVRKLYTLMQYLGPLPDSVCLSMILSYYDDVTPQEYQPPGFKEGTSEGLTFEKESVKLTMGEVITPFHTLKVDVTTERERLEQVDGMEPLCSRDKPALKGTDEETMEEEVEVVTRTMTIQQSDMANGEMPDKLDTEITIQHLEQHTYQNNIESEERVDACQVESIVRKTSDMEVSTRRTRSGRLIRSTEIKPDAPEQLEEKKQVKSSKDKTISQMEFPLSQDPQPSHPKKRKFSEPKDI